MNAVVYDAGALIAADRNDRRLWAEHRVRLELGIVPRVPAPAVAQVSRSPKQASLRRLLAGCDVVSFDEEAAHRVGLLLARSKTRDIVDAAVVDLASDREAEIITSDPNDLGRLLGARAARTKIIRI